MTLKFLNIHFFSFEKEQNMFALKRQEVGIKLFFNIGTNIHILK